MPRPRRCKEPLLSVSGPTEFSQTNLSLVLSHLLPTQTPCIRIKPLPLQALLPSDHPFGFGESSIARQPLLIVCEICSLTEARIIAPVWQTGGRIARTEIVRIVASNKTGQRVGQTRVREIVIMRITIAVGVIVSGVVATQDIRIAECRIGRVVETPTVQTGVVAGIETKATSIAWRVA